MDLTPLSSWRDDDSAVSPVIAVILMVAITVVLAAVVYTWASGLADTGGGGGQPGSCSQGSGNFITIGDVSRTVARDTADYKMTSKDTGDVYTGREDPDDTNGAPDSTTFDYAWSGTSGSDIDTGDSFKVIEQPGGSGSNNWDDGDRFTFAVQDNDGNLLSCPFSWEE